MSLDGSRICSTDATVLGGSVSEIEIIEEPFTQQEPQGSVTFHRKPSKLIPTSKIDKPQDPFPKDENYKMDLKQLGFLTPKTIPLDGLPRFDFAD